MYVIKPLILCGGSGSRLWPLSRADFPKQFIEYSDDTNGTRSLFKSALTRLVVGKMNESIEVEKCIMGWKGQKRTRAAAAEKGRKHSVLCLKYERKGKSMRFPGSIAVKMKQKSKRGTAKCRKRLRKVLH